MLQRPLTQSNRTPPAIPIPVDPVKFDRSSSRGASSAGVAMIEFSDFECPFCGRFAEDVAPELVSTYVRDGRILLAFRHNPLTRAHPNAARAAEASLCAAAQGRFWQLHDLLFQNRADLGEQKLRGYALAAGLEIDPYDSCMKDKQVAEAVKSDVSEAARLRITGTPVFLVGLVLPGDRVAVREVVRGARPIEDFRAALDRALQFANQARGPRSERNETAQTTTGWHDGPPAF